MLPSCLSDHVGVLQQHPVGGDPGIGGICIKDTDLDPDSGIKKLYFKE